MIILDFSLWAPVARIRRLMTHLPVRWVLSPNGTAKSSMANA